MKINRFFAFQEKAIKELHTKSLSALQLYKTSNDPQIVSFTAPTGSGKTIMSASFMENMFNGTNDYPEMPESIFIWLSDSPELNQQSKDKIDNKCDKIHFGQTITISEDSFDKEVLEDGHIYFINTQKLGTNSNLTKHSDNRQYTIWETFENTIEQKSDHLFVIIDEAHRGARGRDIARATTIMQKFIKGSVDDGLKPFPVVIGMSATTERFNALTNNLSRTVHKIVVTADEVRGSGLLKDKIIITYPDSSSANELSVLEAAADEWKSKWNHWLLFCQKYHHAYINPIFLIQVTNGNEDELSSTDIDACLQKIEHRTGFKFEKGEVVHTFGQTNSSILINGLEVIYYEPSKINDDNNIKVVFFKENLNTGWDCPRAETMMSFRHASDSTYIAQLLGRMVRTPIQSRISSDESLNDVRLFLPYFDKNTVEDVVEALQNTEGGTLPTDIISDSIGGNAVELMGSTTPLKIKKVKKEDNDPKLNFEYFFDENEEWLPTKENEEVTIFVKEEQKENQASDNATSIVKNNKTITNIAAAHKESEVHFIEMKLPLVYVDVDRRDIIKHINNLALTTYNLRSTRINDYLTSLFKLARFLNQTGLNKAEYSNIKNYIVEMIHDYKNELVKSKEYETQKERILKFELHSKVFDVFGMPYEVNKEMSLFSSTDLNLDIQIKQAENELGKEGITKDYGRKYMDPDEQNDYKIDLILFTLNSDCITKLKNYAKEKFFELNDNNRRLVPQLLDTQQKIYSNIIKDGSEISETNFTLPETTAIKKAQESDNGDDYKDHLFVNETTNSARISLNGWEKDIIKEEQKRGDYICWLRNPSRGNDSLCIKYTHNGQTKPFYPDFLIVRSDSVNQYVVDILEPHNPSFDDNVGKAKGLAEYAKKHMTILGRAQLIREDGTPHKYKRLDMCKTKINEEVLKIQNAEELNHLFDIYGERNDIQQ